MASAAIPKLPAGAPRPRDGWLLFADGAKYLLEKWELLHTAVVEEWGGKGSRAKFDRIVDDLLMNCEEQWRDGHDLHIDTLDVYLLEVRARARRASVAARAQSHGEAGPSPCESRGRTAAPLRAHAPTQVRACLLLPHTGS